MTDVVPLTIVGGYLGAGKTTLVNHLLREARGLRIAVLVNDFGALPVDADLIVSRAASVIHVAGGCVCCTFGDDLVAALMALATGARTFDHIVVETSGVSLPQGVAGAVTLIRPVSLASTVVVVDASTLENRVADRYMGDTIVRQLAQADRIVVNKVDRVPPGTLPALRAIIASSVPDATVFESAFAAVAPALLLGPRTAQGDRAAVAAKHDPATDYEAVTYTAQGGVDVCALATALADPQCGVVRAKGVLRGLDGALHVAQIVDGVVDVTPHEGDHAPREGVVCIGLRGRWDRSRLDAVVAASGLRVVQPRRSRKQPGVRASTGSAIR